MTRDSTPARDTSTLRRWLSALAVLLLAALAGLGNAPGPVINVVRRSTTGAHPPSFARSNEVLTAKLPPGRSFVALSFWQYGRSKPLLRIRARSSARPLPSKVEISSRLPGLDPADFDIVKATGSAAKALQADGQLGWFAVRVQDTAGQWSVAYIEAGRRLPAGYFSCSRKGNLVREEYARKLAPPDVRSHFEASFAGAPALHPHPAPPAKKRTTPAPGPPSKKRR